VMTCTVECWTPQECAACRMRISPSGRAVADEAANGYCMCWPAPPTRQHLWDEHDPNREIHDPDAWATHVAGCVLCGPDDEEGE